jgi:hypothetical protein
MMQLAAINRNKTFQADERSFKMGSVLHFIAGKGQTDLHSSTCRYEIGTTGFSGGGGGGGGGGAGAGEGRAGLAGRAGVEGRIGFVAAVTTLGLLEPPSFSAITVNWYRVLGFNPLITQPLFVDLHCFAPGFVVTR